jgi:hypothetical protein
MLLLFAQVLLPIALLACFVLRPPANRAGLLLHVVALLFVVLALRLTGLWTVMPWWLPNLYAMLGVGGTILAVRPGVRRRSTGGAAPVRASMLLAVCLLAGWFVAQGVAGRIVPHAPAVALLWPLGPGHFIVANGGTNLAVSSHADTLDLSVPRHRAWWGQSYGIDLVALNGLGRSTSGLQPKAPDRYVIFGKPVLAPCSGRVVMALDGRPDMPVPQMDLSVRPGNHVILRCGNVDVLLAHLRRGSVSAKKDHLVRGGDPIGQVGNSGATGEPHLHIHSQTPGSDEAPFSGRPLPVRFNGRFLVRNERV